MSKEAALGASNHGSEPKTERRDDLCAANYPSN